MKELEFYTQDNGKIPVQEWLNSLDLATQARIYARFSRLEEGNLGDFKKINSEISEFRFKFGKGYRIYFSQIDDILILLLVAGDKKSQVKDIEKSQKYLQNWKERQNG